QFQHVAHKFSTSTKQGIFLAQAGNSSVEAGNCLLLSVSWKRSACLREKCCPLNGARTAPRQPLGRRAQFPQTARMSNLARQFPDDRASRLSKGTLLAAIRAQHQAIPRSLAATARFHRAQSRIPDLATWWIALGP